MRIAHRMPVANRLLGAVHRNDCQPLPVLPDHQGHAILTGRVYANAQSILARGG